MSFFDFLTEEIAIDLGTANTLIIHNDKVVIDSPSIVARDRVSGKIIAVGNEANLMQGKTHENIKTIRPLKDGVIADFDASEQMISLFIKSIPALKKKFFSPSFKLQRNKENYFVTACRLEPYKRVDLIVQAFNKTDENLIIIGSGSQYNYLRRIASKNIKFIEYSNSSVVYNYVSQAKAFIHAGIEDFGIAPVEAQACGTPVIAIKKGGLKETVIENKTGVFFEKQDPNAILEAMNRFNKIDFDYEFIRNQSLKYSTTNFELKIKKFIKSIGKNDKS